MKGRPIDIEVGINGGIGVVLIILGNIIGGEDIIGVCDSDSDGDSICRDLFEL